MKLIECNEISFADSNKFPNSDALTSAITWSSTMTNAKGVDAREIQNVANLIMLSNSFALWSLDVENADMSLLICQVNIKGMMSSLILYINHLMKKLSTITFSREILHEERYWWLRWRKSFKMYLNHIIRYLFKSILKILLMVSNAKNNINYM